MVTAKIPFFRSSFVTSFLRDWYTESETKFSIASLVFELLIISVGHISSAGLTTNFLILAEWKNAAPP